MIGGIIMDYKTLGLRIKSERVKKELTQALLAERVDVSTAFIGQIERGERKFSVENLVAICNALSVSVDYLLRDSLEFNTNSILSEIYEMLDGQDQKTLVLSSDIIRSILKYIKD